jgi:hypothetical protein
MPIKVVVPKGKEKLVRQLKALDYQIKRDTNERDREIHQDAYNTLMEEYLKEE